jgi:photosystem II stability/assembly factor-like uncharacterized protein
MKAFKHTVFIFSIFIISQSTLFSQVYWIEKQSPVTTWLLRCDFADTLNGWACGESGVILHTSNGGENWIQQFSNNDYLLEGISFINSRVGWCIGNDYSHLKSLIFYTSNSGSNWSVNPYPDSTLILNTIYFLDSLNGYMGGYSGTILKTSNAGNTWKLMAVDSSQYFTYHIMGIRFFNHKIGVAFGGVLDFGGVLWKTTNYGLNWNAFLVSSEPVFDVVYLDSANAYASSGEFDLGAGFIKTRDNWLNFDYTSLGFFGEGRAVAMRTPEEIWIPLSFAEKWAVSTDAGENWLLIDNPDSNSVYDALFIDSTHGWAVGGYGKVFKFNKEIIGIGALQKGSVVFYKLYQNYPNPFNPVTKIYFELPENTYVKLSVYDILGREVTSLVDGEMMRGKHESDWNASGYPSGVYFYKISTGTYAQTKKMVLLK